MAEASTWTVNPQADVGEDLEDVVDRVLDLLLEDPRASGVGAVATGTSRIVSSIFQIDVPGGGGELSRAAELGAAILDDALEAAGVVARTTAIALCAGDDPDRLP